MRGSPVGFQVSTDARTVPPGGTVLFLPVMAVLGEVPTGVGSLVATGGLGLKEARDGASRTIQQNRTAHRSISDETPASVGLHPERGLLHRHIVAPPIRGIVSSTALVRSGDE